MPRRPAFYFALALLFLMSLFLLWRTRRGEEAETAVALAARLSRNPFDNETRLALAEAEYRGGMRFLREEPPWPTGTSETEAILAWQDELAVWATYGEEIGELRRTAQSSPGAFARLFPARRSALGRRLLRRAILGDRCVTPQVAKQHRNLSHMRLHDRPGIGTQRFEHAL